MGLRSLYEIREIPNAMAMEMVVANHYLHRKAPCMQAWGLWEYEREAFVGCITYGTPAAAGIRRGVCGEDEQQSVGELTRLWIQDATPKNAESFLIGNTMRKVKKEILVSYAECEQGHVGTVYQATNWIYTGLSAKRTNWRIEGLEQHNQTLTDQYTSKQAREKFGDRFTLVPRPRKHRYVFINAKGRRKQELLEKLRYEPQPYPKTALEGL